MLPFPGRLLMERQGASVNGFGVAQKHDPAAALFQVKTGVAFIAPSLCKNTVSASLE